MLYTLGVIKKVEIGSSQSGQTKDIERNSRLLKFCYVPTISAASSKGIFAAAIYKTNQTNKAGSTCH
jgi:hypothetical protein